MISAEEKAQLAIEYKCGVSHVKLAYEYGLTPEMAREYGEMGILRHDWLNLPDQLTAYPKVSGKDPINLHKVGRKLVTDTGYEADKPRLRQFGRGWTPGNKNPEEMAAYDKKLVGTTRSPSEDTAWRYTNGLCFCFARALYELNDCKGVLKVVYGHEDEESWHDAGWVHILYSVRGDLVVDIYGVGHLHVAKRIWRCPKVATIDCHDTAQERFFLDTARDRQNARRIINRNPEFYGVPQ